MGKRKAKGSVWTFTLKAVLWLTAVILGGAALLAWAIIWASENMRGGYR